MSHHGAVKPKFRNPIRPRTPVRLSSRSSCYDSCLLLAIRLPAAFSPASLSTSPGWQLSPRQIFSNVPKLIPSALPFFSRHSRRHG